MLTEFSTLGRVSFQATRLYLLWFLNRKILFMSEQFNSDIHPLPNNGQKDVDVDTYDKGIIPAETAARKDREGEHYKEVPPVKGYTVDKEGLLNNYAIEPEMYVDQPGDLKAEEESAREARLAELADVRDDDEEGKLTTDGDMRGRGPGVI